MTEYQSQLLRSLASRGYIYQCTAAEALDVQARDGSLVAYIGFDATADSLHVGSLVQIMVLRQLQRHGHKPIILMGGGTSLVGDPSGKDKTRQMLSESDIANNILGIKKVFAQFLDFGEGATDAVMVNNAEWLKGLNYIDFLRDVGKHFSMNRMINFESVKLRLDREQPLSFLEFNYMVLQAYDFLELSRRYGCVLQVGGADQWGNIVCGIDLARRLDSAELYGLTTPLLTTSSGAKMGKTESGAVWLNKEKLSAYDYWQFWRNAEDLDVGRFLRLFTELSEDEIVRLESLQGSELNDAKIILANAACGLCHGEDESRRAEAAAASTFGGGGVSEALPTLLLGEGEEVGLLAVLRRLGFTSSNGEGRRLIEQGGIKVNDEVVSDLDYKFFSGVEDVIKVSVGKKRHGLVRWGGED